MYKSIEIYRKKSICSTVQKTNYEFSSIKIGNYSLSRVLPQIYSVNPDPIKSHIMTLVSILANCENSGKLALLSLFGHVAKDNPAVRLYLFNISNHYSSNYRPYPLKLQLQITLLLAFGTIYSSIMRGTNVIGHSSRYSSGAF